jgi:hypothetical protein
LTEKAVRRGVFLSVPDLVAAIEAFLAAWNDKPQPFLDDHLKTYFSEHLPVALPL